MAASDSNARTRRVALGAASALLVVATASCTLVSGVEDYEIRRVVPAPTATSTSNADPVPTGDAGTSEGGATPANPQPKPDGPTSGPKLCGAEGTWMPCEPPTLLGTCADSCKAKGLTCVDSCCLEDSLGKYPAKTGMAFSLPELLCSVDAVVTNTTGGYCTDPLAVAGATGMDVRCCCK